MKRCRLKHFSNAPGSSGSPGDIVVGPDELVDSWVEARGAVFIEDVHDEYDSTPAPVAKRRGRPPKNVEAYKQPVDSFGDPGDSEAAS